MSKHIGGITRFKDLFLFALPSIVMMIFMSAYTIMDGIFISNLVGNDAFAALSLVFPIINVFLAVGVMLSSGGGALVAKFFGQKEVEKGNRIFSAIYIVAILIAFLGLSIIFLFIDPILKLLGTSSQTHGFAKEYITIFLIFSPFAMVQMLFQTFFVVAGKPKLGLCLTVIAGLTNAICDYVFMGPLNLGIKGAAYATVLGYMITSVPGSIYFLVKKEGLHLMKPTFRLEYILKAMGNGSSEMVSNLATAVTTLVFNLLMQKMVGDDGVVAMSAILYGQYLLVSVFMGYSIGVAPVISFNYGAKKENNVKRLAKLSYIFIASLSILICILTILTSPLLAKLFDNGNMVVNDLITRGMRLFGIGFLITGTNIFSSAFFTSLSDGFTSALISFMRTFVFIIINVFTLSYLFKVTGLLLAIPLAEAFTLLLTIIIFKHQYQKRVASMLVLEEVVA